MVAWRASSSMTLLPNGKVLVAGGFTTDQRSAELFDPATGNWNATGEMVGPRGDGQTAMLLPNGKVLVVGGGSTAETELYDPVTGTWTATGALVKATNGPTATLLANGTVLVAGGLGAASDSDALTAAQLYDPATGTWSATASLREARITGQQILLPDGRALVFGGSTTASGGTFLTSSELYVP
jgi:N-acetylneuraminic acid mutarotase